MAKISDLTSLSTAITGDDLLAVAVVGAPNVSRKAKVSELLAGAVQPIQDPTTLNGVDSTTTARLIYGINVVRTSTISNFCTRLPVTPQKGKSVIVVNLGAATMRVFPSVTGGSINGVVDGHVDIPPSSKSVQISCWENPLPGGWSSTQSTNSVITIPDFAIAHTSGTADVRCGTVTPISSAIGSGTDGSGNMTLSPASTNWRSENLIATAVKLKVYTNIVTANLASDSLPDCVQVWRSQAYKTGSSGSTSAQWETLFVGHSGVQTGVFFPDTTGGIVSGGVLNAPPEIGDVGTFYGEVLAPVNAGNQIGMGGAFSNYYYIFGFQIPSTAATKTYKFRVILEYI